jgi:hypothetical protein
MAENDKKAKDTKEIKDSDIIGGRRKITDSVDKKKTETRTGDKKKLTS